MRPPATLLLTNLFQRYPDIAAVYLFGSLAAGHAHARSDVDLALVPRHDTALHDKKLELLTELARVGFDNVDLVILDSDDVVMQYQAIAPNQLIYAAPDFDHGAAFSNAVRRYLDLSPYLERQRQAYRKGPEVLDPEVIHRRLKKLDEILAILAKLRRYSYDTFTHDPEHYGSTERFLQLAIETLIDIGSHVIAELGLGTVGRYSDIPSLLAEHGYLNAEQRETWIQMIGFRNILVHNYLDIDRKIVYEVLQQHLGDLANLRDAFSRFL